MVHDRRQRSGLNRDRAEVLLLAVVAIAALATLRWSMRDVAVLHTDLYRDDAYYYFEFVRNLLTGRGPVIGDGPPTNGVQFLWVICLAPLHWIGGDALLEGGARWLGLACLLLGAVVLGGSLRREGLSARLSWSGGLLLCAIPLLAIEAQNGQESGLAVLVTVLLLRARDAHPGWFLLAALAAVLTRPELLLLVTLLASVRRESWTMRCAAPAASLCAYGAINLLLAGHVTPDAGWPMAFMAHDKFAATRPDFAAWLRQLWWWGRPALLGGPFAIAGGVGCAALAALAAPRWLRPWHALLGFLLTLCAWAFGRQDLLVPLGAFAMLGFAPSRDADTVRLARRVLVAALGIVVLHDLVRWSPRDYYWVPIGVVGAWALVRVASALPTRALAVLASALVVVHSEALHSPPRRFSWQADHRVASQCIGAIVPREARVGAFNAGLLAWQCDRAVVNLDGVVNPAAFAAMVDGDLHGYLEREGIDWLCDDPRELRIGPDLHARGSYLAPQGEFGPRFEEVARFVDLRAPEADREGWGRWTSLWFRGDAPERRPRPRDSTFDLGDLPGLGRLFGVRSRGDEALALVGDGATPRTLPRAPQGVVQFFALPAPTPGCSMRLLRGTEQLLEYR